MDNIYISKVLTNNGVTIAYELSNGHQLPLEEAIQMAKSGELQNVTVVKDENANESLRGTGDNPFSLNNIPHENINKPSD